MKNISVHGFTPLRRWGQIPTSLLVFFLAVWVSVVFAQGEAAAKSNGKPVAFLGYGELWIPIQQICQPEGIEYVTLDDWLPPAEYSKYSAVYIEEQLYYLKNITKDAKGVVINMWTGSAETRKQVEDYLHAGGVIILTGRVPIELGKPEELEPLLGFASPPYSKPAKGVRIKTKSSPLVTRLAGENYGWGVNMKLWEWVPMWTPTTAEVIAASVGEDGEEVGPFITVNTVGKGKVFWFAAPLWRVFYFAAKKQGEADEVGKYELSKDEKEADAYCQLMTAVILSADPARKAVKREKWDNTPLGPASGTPFLVPEKGFPPEWKKAQALQKSPATPATGQGVTLAENGKARAVFVMPDHATPRETQSLKTLREHLQAMSGGDFAVIKRSDLGQAALATDKGIEGLDAKHAGMNFLCLGQHADFHAKWGISTEGLGPEGMVLRTIGNTAVVAGKDDAGLRHATYAFLETLGCRYLWPGELGKVVPRAPTMLVPPLNVCEAPRLWSRLIRCRFQVHERQFPGLEKLGLTKEEYDKRMQTAINTDLATEDWFQWHPMGGHRQIYRGHAFGHLWEKYGKEHPEWFALQANGVRDQSRSSDRPRLCKSNPDLIAAIVKEKLEELRTHPEQPGTSVCPNDGGYTSFCMCENCRKLDPVDAPRKTMRHFARGRGAEVFFPYVSLTDRVLWWANQIAAGVAREFPDKHCGFYAYSLYSSPPVTVKPHPNLIILYTESTYRNDEARRRSLWGWSQWTRFGNKMAFRPNLLLDNRYCIVPQDFSRKLLQDFRYLYETGMIATDFDSCQNNWALMGLIYYTLAKAHWNPLAMDYEAVVQDYCRSGFGAAANAVRKYFSLVEKVTDRAATPAEMKDLVEFYTPEDLQAMAACLEDARQAARKGGDERVARRVEFLALGLRLGEGQVKLKQAETEGNQEKIKQAAADLKALLLEVLAKEPLAINAAVVATACKHLVLAPLVMGPRDIYVSTNGASASPYTNWADASTNIQWAVNVANNGDTVWISNGVYWLTDQISVSKGITVRSVNGNTNTVIDGNSPTVTGRCLYINHTNAVVQDFTIRNASNSAGYGGGVYIDYGLLLNCIVTSNAQYHVTYGGGGVYVSDLGRLSNCVLRGNSAVWGGGIAGAGTAYNCLIVSNFALNGGGGVNGSVMVNCTSEYNIADNYGGGGAYGPMLASNCVFRHNYATNSYGGAVSGNGYKLVDCLIVSNRADLRAGGLYITFDAGGAVVSNCVIAQNTSSAGGGICFFQSNVLYNCTLWGNSAANGGAAYLYAGPVPALQNCIITNNSATDSGGGVFMRGNSLRQCLIAGNTATNYGGGLYLYDGTEVIESCDIVANTAINGGGVYAGSQSPTATFYNTIIYSNVVTGADPNLGGYATNASQSYINCNTFPVTTNSPLSVNNTSADPRFVDFSAGNYRLTEGAPGVNTGTNMAWMIGAMDLDRRRRLDAFSGIVDMGCYEYRAVSEIVTPK